jgi:hypothetical protein
MVDLGVLQEKSGTRVNNVSRAAPSPDRHTPIRPPPRALLYVSGKRYHTVYFTPPLKRSAVLRFYLVHLSRHGRVTRCRICQHRTRRRTQESRTCSIHIPQTAARGCLLSGAAPAWGGR